MSKVIPLGESLSFKTNDGSKITLIIISMKSDEEYAGLINAAYSIKMIVNDTVMQLGDIHIDNGPNYQGNVLRGDFANTFAIPKDSIDKVRDFVYSYHSFMYLLQMKRRRAEQECDEALIALTKRVNA